MIRSPDSHFSKLRTCKTSVWERTNIATTIANIIMILRIKKRCTRVILYFKKKSFKWVRGNTFRAVTYISGQYSAPISKFAEMHVASLFGTAWQRVNESLRHCNVTVYRLSSCVCNVWRAVGNAVDETAGGSASEKCPLTLQLQETVH